MIRRPPRSTRTDTLFPYTTLFRSQDLGDLVQECFRRLAMAKGGKLALIEKPGAYLVSTARNLLTDRARADTARLTSQHHSFEDEDIAGPDPHAALEARDTMRRVGEANEKLKDRKSVVRGKSGSVRVDHSGRRTI